MEYNIATKWNAYFSATATILFISDLSHTDVKSIQFSGKVTVLSKLEFDLLPDHKISTTEL